VCVASVWVVVGFGVFVSFFGTVFFSVLFFLSYSLWCVYFLFFTSVPDLGGGVCVLFVCLCFVFFDPCLMHVCFFLVFFLCFFFFFFFLRFFFGILGLLVFLLFFFLVFVFFVPREA